MIFEGPIQPKPFSDSVISDSNSSQTGHYLPVTVKCPICSLQHPCGRAGWYFLPREGKAKIHHRLRDREGTIRKSIVVPVGRGRAAAPHTDSQNLPAPGVGTLLPSSSIYRDAQRHRAGPDPVSTSLGLQPKSKSSIISSPGNGILRTGTVHPSPAGAGQQVPTLRCPKINYFLYFFPLCKQRSQLKEPRVQTWVAEGGRAACPRAEGGITVCSRPPSYHSCYEEGDPVPVGKTPLPLERGTPGAAVRKEAAPGCLFCKRRPSQLQRQSVFGKGAWPPSHTSRAKCPSPGPRGASIAPGAGGRAATATPGEATGTRVPCVLPALKRWFFTPAVERSSPEMRLSPPTSRKGQPAPGSNAWSLGSPNAPRRPPQPPRAKPRACTRVCRGCAGDGSGAGGSHPAPDASPTCFSPRFHGLSRRR